MYLGKLLVLLKLATLGLSGCCWHKTEVNIECKAGWPSEIAKRSADLAATATEIDAMDSRKTAGNITNNGTLTLDCKSLQSGSRSKRICLSAREVLLSFPSKREDLTNSVQRVMNRSQIESRNIAAGQCCQWTKTCAEFMRQLDDGHDTIERGENWDKVWCCIDQYLFSLSESS